MAVSAFEGKNTCEFGGPDGGDGACGNVIGKCVEGLNTLIDFRYQQHFIASRGQDGMGKNKSGKPERYNFAFASRHPNNP